MSCEKVVVVVRADVGRVLLNVKTQRARRCVRRYSARVCGVRL